MHIAGIISVIVKVPFQKQTGHTYVRAGNLLVHISLLPTTLLLHAIHMQPMQQPSDKDNIRNVTMM